MSSRKQIMLGLFALLFFAGCASDKISGRQQLYTGQLPRPGQIWVYDFVVTQSDVPAESALAGQPGATSQTAEHIAEGRKLSASLSTDLVKKIREMGMPAEHATAASRPQLNDLVIRGYLLSFAEGSAEKRMAIGFGSGSSDLRVAVEGFQMTSQGLRKLGGGTSDAGGGKSPGMALGAATFLATHNPAGLIVSTGLKVYGEESGKSKIEGRVDQQAKEIADQLKIKFQEQGWIN